MAWRQEILKKIMRPEYGYTFTGFQNGEPLRFCYQEETGQYLVGSGIDYYAPTITGWKMYLSAFKEPKEVEFQKWMYGILDNIFEEFCAKMDGLRKEIAETYKIFEKPIDNEEDV